LSHFEPVLAIWVADAPAQVLPIFHDVARAEVLKRFGGAYNAIHAELFVRITDLPIEDAIRDLQAENKDAFIKTFGVVTRRTGIFPPLQSVKYDCMKCGFIIGPLVQNAEAQADLFCPPCQSQGPFSKNVEQTIYPFCQKVTLHESPGSVPAGQLPRSIDVVLLHDLIDCARPGDEVEVTGIYTTNNLDASLSSSGCFPVCAAVVEANYVRRRGGADGGGHGLPAASEENGSGGSRSVPAEEEAKEDSGS
jgi:DNA replication licensing factor MCM2